MNIKNGMKYQVVVITATLSLFILFFSCKKTEQKKETLGKHGRVSEELYPLKLQNWWHYKQSQFDPSGKETVLPDYQEKIDAIGRLNGDTFYTATGTGVWRRSLDNDVLQIWDNNGLTFIRFLVNNSNAPQLLASYSMAERADSNKYTYYALPGYQTANSYDKCIVTKAVLKNMDNSLFEIRYHYLVRGVGVVLIEAYRPTGWDTATYLYGRYTLDDYYLN